MRTFGQLDAEEQKDAVTTVWAALWDEMELVAEKETRLMGRSAWEPWTSSNMTLPRLRWRKYKPVLIRNYTNALMKECNADDLAASIADEALYPDPGVFTVQLESDSRTPLERRIEAEVWSAARNRDG
jgi:hypothetical protein